MINKIANKQQLEFLLARHGSDAEVARHLKISRQAVRQHRIKFKIPINKNKQLGRNIEINYLYKKGYTINELAKAMRLSRTQIGVILKERKVVYGSKIKKSSHITTGAPKGG